MVDIATDFASLDDDWHYLALTEDVRGGVDPTPGARLTAGSGSERWSIEVIEATERLVRFKLLERLAAGIDAHARHPSG